MARPYHFRRGDLVVHIAVGPGLVTRNLNGEVVYVTYENGALGEYDERWFEMYPDALTKVDIPRGGVSDKASGEQT